MNGFEAPHGVSSSSDFQLSTSVGSFFVASVDGLNRYINDPWLALIDTTISLK